MRYRGGQTTKGEGDEYWKSEVEDIAGRFGSPKYDDHDRLWFIRPKFCRVYGGMVFKVVHRLYGDSCNITLLSDQTAKTFAAKLNGLV